MLQRGPGILHHDVPEGDSVAAVPAALAPHVEQAAAAPVVPVGPGVDHRDVLHHQLAAVQVLATQRCQHEGGTVTVLPVHHCTSL